MTTTQMVKLKVGQVWKSRDPREQRSVTVRGFEGDKVIVQTTDAPKQSKSRGHWRTTKTGKIFIEKHARKPTTSKVARERFNTTSSRGYELEKDVT